jgi:hypothetical protein
MAYSIGNPGPGLEQGQKCGVKPVYVLNFKLNKGVVILYNIYIVKLVFILKKTRLKKTKSFSSTDYIYFRYQSQFNLVSNLIAKNVGLNPFMF